MHDVYRRAVRSKWYLPLVCVVLGGVMLAAFAAGGRVDHGVESLAIMTGFGLVVLLGGRSETVRGLRGDGEDERFALIGLKATAIAGLAVILAVIIGFLVAVARGHDGSPYAWLGAIGAGAYLLSVVTLRVRS